MTTKTLIERAQELLASEDWGPISFEHYEAVTAICRALIAAEERAQELERALDWTIRTVRLYAKNDDAIKATLDVATDSPRRRMRRSD